MDSDPASNLTTYKMQLTQVQAALTANPTNTDMLQLQSNLLEVIDLTMELVSVDKGGAVDSAADDWQLGDKCDALWAESAQYHAATVEHFIDQEHCQVRFHDSQQQDSTLIKALRPYGSVTTKRSSSAAIVETIDNDSSAAAAESSSTKMAIAVDHGMTIHNARLRREEQTKRRDYLKRKSEKKRERIDKIDKVCESEKNKWLQFKRKTIDKKKGGFAVAGGKSGTSIFASPKETRGRVGVGTCGISGRPMTDQVTLATPAQRGVYNTSAKPSPNASTSGSRQ